MRYFLILFFIFCSFTSQAQEVENALDLQYYEVQKGDNISLLARRFDLGINEILRANLEIENKNILRVGEKIILPITHLLPNVKNLKGIVINLAEPRLYYFSDDDDFSKMLTFPIAIGSDAKTPTGKSKIIGKRDHPSWTPPQSIREENPNLPDVILPGPNNPLGEYALEVDSSRDSKWHNILIHGANDPWSIGGKVSHGCIRLYPKDIKELFDVVEVGVALTVVDQPLKVRQIGGRVYIESHLNDSPDQVAEGFGAYKTICKYVENCDEVIDWSKVDEVIIENRGVPIVVSK